VPEAIPSPIRPAHLAFPWRLSLTLTAVVGTVIANLRGIEYWPFFTAGLSRILLAPTDRNNWKADVIEGTGWLIYVALIAQLLFMKNRQRFFVVFALLCCLLMFNTVGCWKMSMRVTDYVP
jgi:hypothetical protein